MQWARKEPGLQRQKAWKPYHTFVPVHKATTLGGAGWRAEVDEAWALEKCSVTGARSVRWVVQLLYDLLWENCMAPFTHEKKQTGCRCHLKRGAVWCHWQSECHPNLLGQKAESSKRGAAKPEWGWESNVVFFTDTQDSQSPVFAGQLFFPWKLLLTAGENLQMKWTEMLIPALTALGNSLSSDSLSAFLCTGSLLPLTEVGTQGVTAMLSGPLIASSLLDSWFYQCSSLAGSLICHLILHRCAIIKKSNRLCRSF